MPSICESSHDFLPPGLPPSRAVESPTTVVYKTYMKSSFLYSVVVVELLVKELPLFLVTLAFAGEVGRGYCQNRWQVKHGTVIDGTDKYIR